MNVATQPYVADVRISHQKLPCHPLNAQLQPQGSMVASGGAHVHTLPWRRGKEAGGGGGVTQSPAQQPHI